MANSEIYDSDGLEYPGQLQIGVNELSYLQRLFHERWKTFVAGMSGSVGFVARPSHGGATQLDFGWSVFSDGSGNLYLRVYPDRSTGIAADINVQDRAQPDPSAGANAFPNRYLAVDANGDVIEVPQVHELDLGIQVTADSVWRTLVVRRKRTKIEPGEITVTTGLTTVTGVNTKFTNHVGKTDPANPNTTKRRGDKIRVVGSANGNDGEIEIDVITDDTNMTLVSPPPGTTETVTYRISGSFLGASPADPDIHNNVELEFELVTRVLPGPGSNQDLIAYDIRRVSGAATLVDRRHSNLWRPVARAGGNNLHAYTVMQRGHMEAYPASQAGIHSGRDWEPGGWKNWNVSSATGDANRFAVSMGYREGAGEEGTHRAVVVLATTTGDMESFSFPVDTWVGGAPGAAGEVAGGVISGGGFDPAIAPMPREYGNTHILVHQSGNNIVYRTSANNGQSWTAATSLWTATSVDPLDQVGDPTVIVTRDHRIIVVAAYFDNSASRWEIRAIWCDNIGDAGLVWDTNSNEGYRVAADLVNDRECIAPDIAQDDEGNLFTVFSHDAAGTGAHEIHMVRGSTPNDPRPSGQEADKQSSGLPITTTYLGHEVNASKTYGSGQLNDSRGPRLWCGPSGMIVFYGISDDNGSGHREHALMAASVAWRDSQPVHLGSAILHVYSMGVASSQNHLGISFVQFPDGTLQLWYVDYTANSIQGSQMPLLLIRADIPMFGKSVLRPAPSSSP